MDFPAGWRRSPKLHSAAPSTCASAGRRQVPLMFTYRQRFSNRNGKRFAISRSLGEWSSLQTGYFFCQIEIRLGYGLIVKIIGLDVPPTGPRVNTVTFTVFAVTPAPVTHSPH